MDKQEEDKKPNSDKDLILQKDKQIEELTKYIKELEAKLASSKPDTPVAKP